MNTAAPDLTQREIELSAIITAYNDVTEQLKQSHIQLRDEVQRLREEVARKNRQLRRRERLAALGEMAAGVAHEIRNPLGGIQLFASLLEKDVDDRPDAVRLVGRIKQGVGALEGIVSDILEFGRQSEPVLSAVDLASVLRESIDLARSRSTVNNVEMRLDVAETCRVITTDPALLQRAVLNLLLNAIDATVAGGGVEVIVTGTVSGDRIVLSVADSGAGVPADLMDRIFNPFFTTKDRGTGLGLAIVHQIAEALGGNVQAANRRQGGAVFAISLPFGETAGQAKRSEG